MTVNEAADRLGLSRWTIRNLARLGRLPAKTEAQGMAHSTRASQRDG